MWTYSGIEELMSRIRVHWACIKLVQIFCYCNAECIASSVQVEKNEEIMKGKSKSSLFVSAKEEMLLFWILSLWSGSGQTWGASTIQTFGDRTLSLWRDCRCIFWHLFVLKCRNMKCSTGCESCWKQNIFKIGFSHGC